MKRQEATGSENHEPNSDDMTREDHPLDGLGTLPYYERMTRFIRGSTRHRVTGGVTVLDFRPLYAVTIHHTQRQLAACISEIAKNEVNSQQLVRIRRLLHQYTDALRDFEFIHGNRWNTQFVKDIAASRLDNGSDSRLQAALISDLGLEANDKDISLFQDSDLLGAFNPKLMEHSTAIRHSLGTMRWKELASEKKRIHLKRAVRRFMFAVVGGLIIIVPLCILTWGHVTSRTLAVTATSISLFALCVAVFSKTEPENLLVITATYAAVLMSLIGTANNAVVG